MCADAVFFTGIKKPHLERCGFQRSSSAMQYLNQPQYTMLYFLVATGICHVPEKPLCRMKASPAA